MKKNNSTLLIVACILIIAGCTTFPAKSQPGLYVNDWPIFTIAYPSDWVEKTPIQPNASFRADSPQGTSFTVSVFPSMGMPLDFSTKVYIPELSKMGKDIKVLYEKKAALKDGTEAYETEIEWITNFDMKLNTLFFTSKKDTLWIAITISDTKGAIGDEMKKIAYSLAIKPGEEKTVSIPPDVREFLDQFSKDMVSHDIAKAMQHYSDQFKHNGIGKSDVESFFKMVIFGITSYQPNITKFELLENKANLAGYVLIGGTAKFPLTGTLIKEDRKWKFYGNQKERTW